MPTLFCILLELWIISIYRDNLKVDLLKLLKIKKQIFSNIFSSDWLYTTKENKDIVIALNASGADVSFAGNQN